NMMRRLGSKGEAGSRCLALGRHHASARSAALHRIDTGRMRRHARAKPRSAPKRWRFAELVITDSRRAVDARPGIVGARPACGPAAMADTQPDAQGVCGRFAANETEPAVSRE